MGSAGEHRGTTTGMPDVVEGEDVQHMLQEAHARPNWSRRYEGPAVRLCARPGCSSVAAATLRFQPTARAACLVDLDVGASRAGDLCARHASVVSLPRGWRLRDERDGREANAAPEPQPQLFASEPEREIVEIAIEVEPEPEPVAEAAPEITSLLNATSPLLRRAFGNAFPGADIRHAG
jgi:hypothetical protein